jgi:transposase
VNYSWTRYVYDTMSTDAFSLPDDTALCHELIRQQADTIRQSQRKIEQLEHYLKQLLRRQFGPRRERLDPDQLALFDAGIVEPVAEDTVETEESSKSQRRRGGGRRPLPKELPRKRIEYQLPEAELPCPECGQRRQKIGEEVSEQLEFVPASLHVIQHVRFKYACRCCQEHVAVAGKPAQPIDRGLPGPGLLAHTITSKYSDHLPLYRLEDIFARHGMELSRSTMCSWMRQSADLLWPLYELMVSRVLASKIIWTDDTPVPVLDRTLPKTRQGRFWVYAGDDRHPYSVYDYTASRNRDGPEQFLKGFRGFLQADAFSGYDRLCSGPGVTEVACWAHARRKFYDARTTAPELAHEVLARIGQLYELERHAKELSSNERCALRQCESTRLLNCLGDLLLNQKPRVLPKSPLGQAISYALANWRALCRYVEDGDLSIDNNLSERALRAQAVGRKNWLFVGSDNGGRTAAVLFSMTASCKRHGIDPFRYLADVLERLPTTPPNRLPQLLPDVWFETHPHATRKRAA